MSDTDDLKEAPVVGLRRTLRWYDGVAILIGITIGAGIYSTPQLIAQYQTSFLPIIGMWCLAGMFVYIGGLIYAELGSRLPDTGGEYVYISHAFGPFAGFVFGWAQLFIIRTSPAAGLAIVVVNYLEHFVEIGAGVQTLLAILVILALGAVNYVGIRQASLFQLLSTVIKVGGLFALVVAGLFLLQGDFDSLKQTRPVESELGPFGLFAATMMLIVFSYLGWDRVGYSAGEMKDPRRTICLSMFWGIGAVVVVYVAANFLYHYTLGMDGVRESERVASDTAIELFGSVGASVVAIMVMISAAGSINGTMMTAPRVYYAMANDKLFFRWFDFIHPVFRTPSRAIIAHCGWAIVILLVRSNFENIIAGMTFAVLIFYVVTTLAFFKIRHEQVGGNDMFKLPLVFPIAYLVGLVALVAMRAVFEWEKSLVDVAFVATGIPFAILFCIARRKEHRQESAVDE